MTEDRLTALVMLSTGKQMMDNISNFNEEVINKFAEKKIEGLNKLINTYLMIEINCYKKQINIFVCLNIFII